MKVRIGISLGPAATPEELGPSLTMLESAGVDSLWLSEVVYGPLVEPFIGMAYALARTSQLKVGTGVAVLPGRHPVLVAKQLASLAALAPGRVLPVFGLRPARRPEAAAFPVPGSRAAVFDESHGAAAAAARAGQRVVLRPVLHRRVRDRRARGQPGRSTSGSAAARPRACAGRGGSPTAGSAAS